MGNLLRLEFRKLIHQKGYYICFGIALLLLLSEFLLLPVVSVFYFLFTLDELELGTMTMVLMPDMSNFSTVMGIFTAMFVCTDYSRHTIKNIVARGYSREQVYLSKLITVWVSATVLYILLAYASFLMALPDLKESYADGSEILAILGTRYVVCMTEIAIFFSAGIIANNTGIAIACGYFLPTVVDLVLGMFSGETDLCAYWIEEFSNGLQYIGIETNQMLLYLVLSLMYIVVILLIGFFVHAKKEIR